MCNNVFPVIDLTATGSNIRRLRIERGLTVRDLQSYFGFEEPQAIYKWQRGESLPSVDNLYALGSILDVPIEQILVPMPIEYHAYDEQQAETCCSIYYLTGYFGCGKSPMQLQPFSVPAVDDMAKHVADIDHGDLSFQYSHTNETSRSLYGDVRGQIWVG